MGTLANSLFQAMLGWIRTLSSQIWTTATASESTTLIAWIGEHWIMLAILLCAVGLILDLVIYLIRWQPWRAWRSFFRRMRHRRMDAGEEEAASSFMEPMLSNASNAHAAGGDPVAYANSAYFPREDAHDRRMNPAKMDINPVGEETYMNSGAFREEEQDIHREKDFDDDPEMLESRETQLTWSRNEPEGTTAAFDRALRPKKRRRVSRIFTESEEETVTPDQLIDQYAAYRRPVYPRSWHTEEGDEE